MKAVKFTNKPKSLTIELPLEVRDIDNVGQLPLSTSSEYWVIMTQKELNNYYDKIRITHQPFDKSDPYLSQQSKQRDFGLKLSADLVDLMGARNLKFVDTGYGNVNVAALLSQLYSIKSLMDTGALKTARSAMIAVKPSFVNYQDIIQLAIDKITVFLTENEFD